MKNLMAVILLSFTVVGCNSLKKLTDPPSSGTPVTGPHGTLAETNVVPFYDQATATPAQDNELINAVIGLPGTPNFNTYVTQSWLPDRMNGISNFGFGTGASSILVDAWKALYRQGYADASKLTNPSILHTNTYPVPVYQDDPKRWNLQ